MRRGFTLFLPSSVSHPVIGVRATQKDALLGKGASFALRRALHGLESLDSPLDKEISFACGSEVHLHPYRKSPGNDNE